MPRRVQRGNGEALGLRTSTKEETQNQLIVAATKENGNPDDEAWRKLEPEPRKEEEGGGEP